MQVPEQNLKRIDYLLVVPKQSLETLNCLMQNPEQYLKRTDLFACAPDILFTLLYYTKCQSEKGDNSVRYSQNLAGS